MALHTILVNGSGHCQYRWQYWQLSTAVSFDTPIALQQRTNCMSIECLQLPSPSEARSLATRNVPHRKYSEYTCTHTQPFMAIIQVSWVGQHLTVESWRIARWMFATESLCLFVNTITSKWLNIGWWNLVDRCNVQKSRPSSDFRVTGPIFGYAHSKMWQIDQSAKHK